MNLTSLWPPNHRFTHVEDPKWAKGLNNGWQRDGCSKVKARNWKPPSNLLGGLESWNSRPQSAADSVLICWWWAHVLTRQWRRAACPNYPGGSETTTAASDPRPCNRVVVCFRAARTQVSRPSRVGSGHFSELRSWQSHSTYWKIPSWIHQWSTIHHERHLENSWHQKMKVQVDLPQ